MTRARQLGSSRRMRKTGLIVLAAVVVYGLAGFFGVPLLARHIVTGQVPATLNRPVSVGKIRFNPYRLLLDVDQFHIGERGAAGPFVDVGHLRLKVSWTSLFRFAPVIKEVSIDRPAIYLVRIAPQQFNFSDLIEKPATPAAAPTPAAASKPQRFAVSNIQLTDGAVRLDDRVLGTQHTVEHIDIGVPFIANLPADVDIFVQPLLEMTVDGSPVHIAGKAKPFAVPPESVVDLDLHRLDLTRYLGYAPEKLPIKMPTGSLSAEVQVHFVNADTGPAIRLVGEVALDQIDLRNAADAPLLKLNHAMTTLTDVEPLLGIVHLQKIRIDGLNAHLVRNVDGTTNLPALSSTGAASKGATSGEAPATAPITAAAPAAPSNPADIALDSFELANSSVKLTDNSAAPPAVISIEGIHVGLKNLRTTGQSAAPFDLNANIGGGGTIAIKGALDLAQSVATTGVSLDQVDLPALQGFARPFIVASVASGKLSAQANVQTYFASGKFNVHAEPASISLDNFDLRGPGGDDPVGWTRLSTSIGKVDLVTREATVNEVRSDRLHLTVLRDQNAQLSLAALLRKPAATPGEGGTGADRERLVRSPHPAPTASPTAAPQAVAAAAPQASPWKYRIAAVAMENTQASVEDDSAPRPVKLAVAPLNLHLKDVSSDFDKPFAVDLDGAINGKGTFKVTGTAALAPLKADLRVATRRVDLAGLDPYLSSRLNATIKSAALTMGGAVAVANERKELRVSYRGDATLGNVRVLDKLTNDNFLNWNAFSASRIDFNLGSGPPKVHIGALALSTFYARIILNKNGKLNLSDVMGGPAAAPVSLTRTQAAPAAPAPAPAATASQAPAPAPIAADIELRRITLQGGRVNYSDNFIQPNYSANLIDVTGKVGAFGTRSTQPADVALQGQVNGSAPIDITGSVNPLSPMAFVDIKAKAKGVELTDLTPYSTRYTGYPITKGTLTVDVHYLLDQQKLTADNHIFIDQLTFGDRVENSTATNLPIRLAVALLKNARGEIDLNVPVSGSLSDPQFSLGSVVLHAFMNLIVKAATSPFTLLGAAFGGGKSSEELAYVEFAPGLFELTPDSQGKLATLANALQQRPGLKLNISGWVDPELDRPGLREAMLMEEIKALKIKDLGRKAAGEAESVQITPEEYDKYLGRVYRAAKFPKPRDAIGLNKSLPPDEMKKLMLANIEVTDQDLQQLAGARANAVRQYLSANKVDPERLFVAAPKLDVTSVKDQGKPTRANLTLE